MRVHERVRSYIESNGMKFNHVAEKAGIDRKKFYRLMDGTSPLSADDYEQICRFGLTVEPGYFFKLKFLESKMKQEAI